MNCVFLSGNIGSDVQVRTSNGTTFAHFNLADDYRVRLGDGSWQSRTNWTRVTAFGGRAEALRVLGKGSRVLVKGHLRARTFEKDGVRLERSEVIADFVEFQDVREPARAEGGEEVEAEEAA